MAILGFHVVISLIALTVISKLGTRSSFLFSLLVDGLYRYIAPSNEDLRTLLPAAAKGGGGSQAKKRRHQREEEERQGFALPKSLPLQLKVSQVNLEELKRFPFWQNVHWLCLFVPVSLLVYGMSECFCAFHKSSDTNVSIVWLLVGVGFSLQIIVRLTAIVLTAGDEEKSLMISLSILAFFALFVMTVFLERLFDISLFDAYSRLTRNAARMIERDLPIRPDSPLLLYISLVVLFSTISAGLIFPSFRYAKMYTAAVAVAGPFTKLLLHVTFFLPGTIVALFSLPMKLFLVEGRRHLLSETQLDVARIYLTLLWVLLRLLLRKPLLQAHLDLAYTKVQGIQKQSGRIRNTQLQSTVFRYYSYLCSAIGQYLAPTLLVFYLALLLKSTGGISWSGAAQLAPLTPSSPESLSVVFEPFICRAVFSFCLLCTLTIIFSLSLVGTVYVYYFATE